MSESIFSIQPPEWLQRRSEFDLQQSTETLNNMAGLIGAGITAGVQSAEHGTNFMTNWSDALNTLKDPYFGIKRKQGELNLALTKSDLDGQNFMLEQKQSEVAEWQKDQPSLMPWISKTPEQRLDTPPPAVSSNKGLDIIRSTEMNDERVLNQKAALKIRSENTKAQITAGQRATDWTNSFAQATPETQAAIAALGPEAYETDAATGRRLPSLEAITILNKDREQKGLPAFGATPAEVAAFSREKIAREKAQATLDAAKTAQQYRIDLEKYKADLRQSQGGKSVSKQEFINRQYGRMITEISQSPDGAKLNTKQIADLSEQILGQVYDKFANAAPAPAADYKSADDVKAAYQSGKISKDDALKILKDQFKMQ